MPFFRCSSASIKQTWPRIAMMPVFTTGRHVGNAGEQTRQQWMRAYAQDAESWDHFMKGYQPGGDQGVYKFRCRHCNQLVFNWDFS